MTDLETAAFSAFKAVTGKVLRAEEAEEIIGGLFSFRYLLPEMFDSAAPAMRDLFSLNATNKVVFPCDVMELRAIFNSDTVSVGRKTVPLFSWSFANRYLREYAVFLLLDASKLTAKKRIFGGVVLVDAEELGIQDAVLNIIVNQPTSDGVVQTVGTLMRETGKGYEFAVSNSVPGISPNMHEASAQQLIKMGMQQPEIQLTPEEANLFNKIKQARDAAGLKGKVEVRAAGGWVRDKLLGKASKDIDFAITNMTGVQFCQACGFPMGAVIAANDAKSKALETVKTHIDGQEVDFANCRMEVYDEHSRRPIQTIGTPEQDAQRRDLTINSMFFNIENAQVEDYIGGREDLANKILRTPMEAKLTFEQDPLRMLRALRFQSRFSDFTMDPAILQAMADPEVQKAYIAKVSMERAGPELMKMFEGDEPSKAIDYLFKTGLYKAAFRTPGMKDTLGLDIDQQNEHHKLKLADHIVEQVRNINELAKKEGWDDEQRGLAVCSGMFHDFGKMHPKGRQPHPKKPGQMQYLGHEDVGAEMADEILKSIGVGQDKRAVVRKVVEMHMRPHDAQWNSRSIGKFIRDSRIPGQEKLDNFMWKLIHIHAIADSMSKGDDSWKDDVAKKWDAVNQFQQYIDAPPAAKPLLSGQQIIQLVPELRPDSGFIKEVQTMLLGLQDERVIATPEQATEKVQEWKAQNLAKWQQLPQKMPKRQQQPQAKPPVPVVPQAEQPQQNQPPQQRQSMNWYKRITVAEKDIYKDTWLEGRGEEIVKLPREKSIAPPKGPAIERKENGEVHKHDIVQAPYRIGDRVRDRTRGTAMKQRYGKIVDLKENEAGDSCYHIRWDDQVELQVVRLKDTLNLAAYLAKA